MNSKPYPVALMVILVSGLGAAAQNDNKPSQPTLPVKVSLDKTEPPIPVKIAAQITLGFCIAEELDTRIEPVPTTGKCNGGKKYLKVGANVDAIVAAFSKDTEYAVQKVDSFHILLFCITKDKACDKGQNKLMVETINSFAVPSPRYYKDVTIPNPSIGKKLADAIEGMTKGAVTGTLITPDTIRLKTDKKLEKPVIDDLLNNQIPNATEASLKKVNPFLAPVNAERVSLPLFCIATRLDGADPLPLMEGDTCANGTRQVRASNAADIAAALTSDKIKVTADSKVSIIVNCGGSKCDSDAMDQIAASVSTMARPSPAYIEDRDVLPETAPSAAAKLAKWSNGVITADVLSDDRIRLKSDTKVPRADIEIFQNRLVDEGFGDPATLPTKELFYADAGTVVDSLYGSAPPVTPLAPGTMPPETTAAQSSEAAGSTATSATTPATATTPPASTAAAPAAPATATATTTTPVTSTGTSAAPAASTTVTFPPPATGTLASGMVPVGDTVVFTGGGPASDSQRVRLLTLLDLPRPEVLLNVFSMQDSSPSGKQLAQESELIRSAVSIHNEALQNAIEYGWAYLSRQMQDPAYFDPDFTNYLTERFVSEPPDCNVKPDGPKCISAEKRRRWGLCAAGAYCLGYTEAFKPLTPTLSNILLGLMAAKDPFRAVFTTIGCMEGKFEVYGPDCFPERTAISELRDEHDVQMLATQDEPTDPVGRRTCLMEAHTEILNEQKPNPDEPVSCEDLDRVALRAQLQCHVPVILPLTCFTVQAAKSFMPYHGFSTFTLRQLMGLAEQPFAEAETQLQRLHVDNEWSFSTTPIGLLRAATIKFLFNYKMAQEFPKEFSPYQLTHSAQELNAEFNPLVVAFNQDVAAFTRNLMSNVQSKLRDTHWYTPWTGRNRSFVADGLITMRGISGVESLVDTDTQSSFSVPQYQTPASVLSNLAGLEGASSAAANTSTTTNSTSTVSGNTTTTTSVTAPTPQPPAPPASANLLTLLPGRLSNAGLASALVAAISPTPASAQIGRQLTLDMTPHALPGASSAELDVKLWAQEDSPPTLYADSGASSQNDPLSRVARHNVFTRVRVESVKLFEVSSFSALVQRPRTKFPLVPPFVEIPVINDLIGLPLPGAKVYYRSTAIVSAIIVPTAADLAFGMEYKSDRAVAGEGDHLSFRRIASMFQLPRQQQKLYDYNQARADCIAAGGPSAFATSSGGPSCNVLTFTDLAPDR